MKVYKFPTHLTATTEELTGYEAVWTLSDVEAELLSAGGTLAYVNGALKITPAPVVVVEETTNIITKRAFLKRITPEEFATIKGAAAVNATVDYYWQMFMLSEEVDLNFPDTIGGITMMEQAGLLATGRAAEILS
jgi:hypothetical protein